jgi:glycosyltransferase involved in cell wall biosynthesis
MKLSIVVPVFNEAGNLGPLHERLTRVARACADDYEIILVDDGSTDASRTIMSDLVRDDAQTRLVALSRNFGHELATTAGLDRADGDAVVIIDADLQDPPEVIAELVARWRAGADVVYARRRRRAGESIAKRATAFAFYRVLNALSEVPIPLDTGDFRLMDRRVVEVLRRCRENPRFVRGLVSWVGFTQTAVLYDRAERHAGETKYNLPKLLRLTWEAICAFSLVPLRLAGWCGGLLLALGVLLGVGMVAGRLVWDIPIGGIAMLTCALLLIGGMQLVVLAILSQYVGHIFRHTQDRPLYVIDQAQGWSRIAKHTRELAARTNLSSPPRRHRVSPKRSIDFPSKLDAPCARSQAVCSCRF